MISRIDKLIATVDQLGAEVDGLQRRLDVLWRILLLTVAVALTGAMMSRKAAA